MTSRRDRRRALLLGDGSPNARAERKLITFGSTHHPASHCSYADAPAEFALCLPCSYNRGASGTGIVCGHRFGLDPTLVGDIPTQLDGDSIRWLDPDALPR
jgi:hypothetical protein